MLERKYDTTEQSCYWSHFGHQRRYCPNCSNLPPCPKCGSLDRMKNSAPVPLPNKWIRCFNCGHDTDYKHTFKEAIEDFYGQANKNTV